MSHACTQERFLRNVAEHAMTVIRDDGVSRHIRFARPGTGSMHFDLITWPGYLCYTGDMGTYVFQRTTDMFEFFRTDRKNRRDPSKLAINLSYWTEKLVAVDGGRHGGKVEAFEESKFKRVIGEWVDGWVKEAKESESLDAEGIRELWAQVKDEIYSPLNDGDHDGAMRAAHEFTYPPGRYWPQKPIWQFTDLFEHDFTEYTHSIVWCCYALAWGIEQYDAAKQVFTEEAPA